ncbi:ComEC family competence protein [Cedecea neteri]|uniref:ComEC family competence protein n=1 Tax=Cedecea neteri TaxID=158822 RepID=A0A2X2TAI3_9ENTR|nr:ComEC family competence protein [Cedecea neteri]
MFSIAAVSGAVLISAFPLLWLPVIPEQKDILLLLAAALALAVFLSRVAWVRYLVLCLLLLSWSLLSARQMLDMFSVFGEKPLTVQVKITRSDGDKRHELRVVKLDGRYLFPAPGVVLRNSELPVPVCEGQTWLMTLRLRPVHGRLNEGVFDGQRYALSQMLPFNGRVLKATQLSDSCNLRGKWLEQAKSATAHLPWQGVIIALGFGERIDVSADVKKIMLDTGTAHLMAISGLHIALAGGIGLLFARAVQFCLPTPMIGFRFPLLVSFSVALFYTWLSGMNPPAVRTLVGMGIWAILRLSSRKWSSWDVLLCCASGIVLSEPMAILSESLWLSALAVCGLIFWYQWVPLPRRAINRWLRPFADLLYLQTGITLLLIPLQVVLFHGISLTSLAANLFAVPWITFVSVPLILAGMVFGEVPSIGQVFWSLADKSLVGVFALLAGLPEGWKELDRRYQFLAFIAWWAIVIWRFGFWRSSSATAATVLLLMTFPFWRKPEANSWAVHMLDVGHGLAMVIEREGKALLYDTGNAWPGGDAAKSVIIPWLKWRNLQPEWVIISHEHLDHIGGLKSLKHQWPALSIRSALRWEEHEPCFRGQQWAWQGIQFEVLWPPEEYEGSGNNRSCVVKVSHGGFSLMLTGDLEASAELTMLRKRWQTLEANVFTGSSSWEPKFVQRPSTESRFRQRGAGFSF